jgi:hypothetical protein
MPSPNYQLAATLLSSLERYGPEENDFAVRVAQVYALLALVDQTEQNTNLLLRIEGSIDHLTTKLEYIAEIMING